MAVGSFLDRVAPLVARAGRLVRSLALVAAAAAAVIVLFLFRNGTPDDAGEWTIAVVGTLLALAPPVILFLLSEALRALAELPAKIRALPSTGTEHLAALGGLAEEARARGMRRLPVVLWRFARLSGETRGLLTPHAAALPLLSVPFLALSAAAAPAAALEVLVALVLLVVLAA